MTLNVQIKVVFSYFSSSRAKVIKQLEIKSAVLLVSHNSFNIYSSAEIAEPENFMNPILHLHKKPLTHIL